MKYMQLLIFSLFCLLAVEGGAGTAEGKVVLLKIANNSPAVLFTLSSAISDTPRCNENKMFSIHLGTISGNALYTLLLQAKKQGDILAVTGLNVCAADWKSEDVDFIIMK